MNGKKAKALRREARLHTVGIPWNQGLLFQSRKNQSIKVRNDPDCGRAVYEKLKAGYHGSR